MHKEKRAHFRATLEVFPSYFVSTSISNFTHNFDERPGIFFNSFKSIVVVVFVH